MKLICKPSVRCHWQEAEASELLAHSKCSAGLHKEASSGCWQRTLPPSPPQHHISRERLKPHVWRPYTDCWKDVPYKQYEAEPVTRPHLWSPTQAPAPRATYCQLLSPAKASSGMVSVAEAWPARRGLSRSSRCKGREGTGSPGPQGRWMGAEKAPFGEGSSPISLGLGAPPVPGVWGHAPPWPCVPRKQAPFPLWASAAPLRPGLQSPLPAPSSSGRGEPASFPGRD